ncbi:hypothetical protein C3L33_13763, partial [Rhododendron williamsianum]
SAVEAAETAVGGGALSVFLRRRVGSPTRYDVA